MGPKNKHSRTHLSYSRCKITIGLLLTCIEYYQYFPGISAISKKGQQIFFSSSVEITFQINSIGPYYLPVADSFSQHHIGEVCCKHVWQQMFAERGLGNAMPMLPCPIGNCCSKTNLKGFWKPSQKTFNLTSVLVTFLDSINSTQFWGNQQKSVMGECLSKCLQWCLT